jgi:hypothetical protein
MALRLKRTLAPDKVPPSLAEGELALGLGNDPRGRKAASLNQSIPIITSDALITTYTLSPCIIPSASMASFVIEDVMIWPPMSTNTLAVVAPFFTCLTIPLI